MEKSVIANEDSELLDLIKRIQLLRLFGINSSNQKYFELLNRTVKIEDLYSRLVFLDECGTVNESNEQIEIMCMNKADFAKTYGSLVDGLLEKLPEKQRIWLLDSFNIPPTGKMNFQKVIANLSEKQISKMVGKILSYAYPYKNEPGKTGIKDTIDSLSATYQAIILEKYPEGLQITNNTTFDTNTIAKLEELFDSTEGNNIPSEILEQLTEGNTISDKLHGEIIRAEDLIAQHEELRNSVLELTESVLEAIKTLLALPESFETNGIGVENEISLKNNINEDLYKAQAEAFVQKLAELLKRHPNLKYDKYVIKYNKSKPIRYYPFKINGYTILEPIGTYNNATYIIPEEKYDEYIQMDHFPSKKGLRADKKNISLNHGKTQILDSIAEHIVQHPEEKKLFSGKRLYDFTSDHFFAIVDHLSTLSHDGITRKSLRRSIKAKALEIELLSSQTTHDEKDHVEATTDRINTKKDDSSFGEI